ncbi:MAG: hypothetical protein N2V77_07130 [Canidatus Methanoxibalbensis ujae]|nr:hypothetical protein [Candidatus Methanoxibalbensis ujae]MCW7078018.1 hypothetical protein [Candidatus Methanoxibalbensis ujae]RLG36681.1 MAG: amino acid-binding protein [Methanosarcinales archaeon]
MWSDIMKKFERAPSQRKVVALMLERGFGVSPEGKVSVNGIEIPHMHIARNVNVDRRVVDAAVARILSDEDLRRIFENIRTIPFLVEIAPMLGMSVLVIQAVDPKERGILGEVAAKIADRGISIRQAVSDDPYFVEDPRLTIITDKLLPGDLIEDIMRLKNVKSVQIYQPETEKKK